MKGNFVCGAELCTACSACVDACPFGALVMIELGSELVPQVDSGQCRSCGRCHAVCPALNPVTLSRPLHTYAAWSCVADDVERSSSGGLATALARMTLRQGGVVFGSASREGIVRCIEVSNTEGLEAIRGSKYVYSSPAGAYRKVKEHLNHGIPVLFVSTPCQVAALRSFLDGKDDGLLCVDLICHGTPPTSFLREHFASRVSDSWDAFSFRGIRDFRLCAYGGNKKVYDKPWFEDEYFSAFEAGVICREVCYECPYARNERVGDLTLGDFWGLDKNSLRSEPPGKVSLVLANSAKGIEALDALPPSVILEERLFSEADNEQQTNLHSPLPRTKDRARFVAALEKKGFDLAVHKTFVWKRYRLRVVKKRLLNIFSEKRSSRAK